MNSKQRLCARVCIGLLTSACVFAGMLSVHADDTQSLENKSASLQQQLKNIDSELAEMAANIADTEIQIESTNNSIISTEEQLSIIENSKSNQYEAMKQRIKFLYEGGNSSLLELLFSSQNMADFINKAYYIENIASYDREQLTELQNTMSTIEDQKQTLHEKKASLESLETELQTKQDALNQKAAQTNSDINAVNSQIAQIKAAQQAAAEAAAQEAARAAAQQVASAETSGGTDGEVTSDGGGYNYPTSGGALTPSKGVVYFNGHRETYYSQKVLPGGGLNIPGRHVAADGTIRDQDNYICVASVDYPRGTVVETSLGPGKVYDSGCAPGTIDIYTNW